MKYVPGPEFGQFSGSQGNTTASHNKFGSYLRNRVIPADPATPKQLAIRAQIQGFSEQWRLLTQAQRDGWKALGDQMTRLDTQGQSYTLTGLQAYTSINMNRDLLSLARNDDPPLLDIPSTVYSITTEAVVLGPVQTITTALILLTEQVFVIEASAGVSAGINFLPRGGYKFMAAPVDPIASPIDFNAQWLPIFGPLIIGTKIFARTRIINDAGFAGAVVKADTIVVAV